MNIGNRILQATSKTFTAQQSEGETLKYTINYAAILGTDTITASTWSHDGLTATSKGNTSTTAYATIHGTTGRYTAINIITTSAGEVIERIINLHITSNLTTPQQGDY